MGRLPTPPLVPATGRVLSWLSTHRDLPPITRLAVALDPVDVQLQLADPDAGSLACVAEPARAPVLLPALLAWHDVLSSPVITIEDRADARLTYIRVHGAVPDGQTEALPLTVYLVLDGLDRDLVVSGLGAPDGPVQAELLRALADATAAEALPVGAPVVTR